MFDFHLVAAAKLTGESAYQPLAIAGIIALAAMFSSIAGFAFAAFAGALMFHVVDDPVRAIQIMIVASIATQLAGVAGIRHAIDWRATFPFLLGGAATLLPGVYLLFNMAPQIYLRAIGLLLSVYGLAMLLRPPIVIELHPRHGRLADMFVGSLGGIMAPLAAFPGAFVPIWCDMRGWDKERQRGTYQPYILIMQVASLGLIQLMQGARGGDATLLLYALPAIVGTQFGVRVFRRLSNAQFRLVLNLCIICSGFSLAWGIRQ